jgi:hypothetical protein
MLLEPRVRRIDVLTAEPRKKQKIKGAFGSHDDEVMSLGIILVSMHLLDVIRNNMPDRRKNSATRMDYLRYKPPLAASSIPEHLLNRSNLVEESYDSEGYVDIASRLRGR